MDAVIVASTPSRPAAVAYWCYRKIALTFVKDRKEDLIPESSAVEFCTKGERLNSVLNRTRKRGDLEPRSRTRGSVDGK